MFYYIFSSCRIAVVRSSGFSVLLPRTKTVTGINFLHTSEEFAPLNFVRIFESEPPDDSTAADTLEAKSISGNIDVRGIDRNKQHVRIPRHQANETKPQKTNEYNVVEEMIN